MKQMKDVMVMGLALFAMFFGAGNLIFPPKLGLVSGEQWWQSLAGFLTTDVGLSILAIIGVARAGGSLNAFAGKVGRRFSLILGAVLMLAIGPLLAVPRTGAVSYEMGFLPLFPATNELVFALIYFGLALVFVLDPKGVMDKIGKWITPILLLALFSIIVLNFLGPAVSIPPATIERVYSNGFLEGYQTVDGLAAVLFAGILLLTLKNKGYRDTKSQIKMTIRASYLAFGLIALVYGGLVYLGASGSGLVNAQMSRTEIFTVLVQQVMGQYGSWVVAVAVIFACFSTTTGLLASVSEYFSEQRWCPLNYKWLVVINTLLSFLLANLGVEQIVLFSGPLLGIIYPAVIVLTVLNLFAKYIPSKAVYQGAVYGALLFSMLVLFSQSGEHLQALHQWLFRFPMGQYEMGWVFPAILGGMLLPLFQQGLKPLLIKHNA